MGDVDGDGNLEVAALTREGNSFLWDTDRPACGGNDEWWTSRHDEWSTGAYGTDSRPPGTPTRPQRDPQRPRRRRSRSRRRATTGSAAQARRYRIVKGSGPIDHPGDGTVVGDFDATASAGQTETRTVADIGQAAARGRALPGRRGQLGPPRDRRRCRAPTVRASCSGGAARARQFSATSGNVKRATRYFLCFPATVSALPRARWTATAAGTGSQNMRGVIYADRRGQPGDAAQAHASQIDVTAGQPAGLGDALPAVTRSP